MKISLGVYPNQKPADVIASARLAEEVGLDTLWMLDSHLLFREVYTMLGAIGASTRRLNLGTAVTNPLTRHLTVTASAFATLSELTGGRAKMGISIGDSALKAMNLEPAKMAQLAEAVEKCRSLLQGDEAAFGEGKIARLAHAPQPVPIYVAATAEKMLGLTARIGDGVILMNGVAPNLIQAALDILHEGERKAGRPEGTNKVVVWAACHPDPEAVKYNVARAILRKIPGPISDLTREVAARIKESYDYREHGTAEASFAQLVPAELVEHFAFSGSPEFIGSQLKELAAIGVDEVVLAIPFAPGILPRDEVMRMLAPVIAPYAAAGRG